MVLLEVLHRFKKALYLKCKVLHSFCSVIQQYLVNIILVFIKMNREHDITFNDDYEHLDNNIEYILESELQADDGSEEFIQLKRLWNTKLENGCLCTDSCFNCQHGNNYIKNGSSFVLNEDRVCKDLIYECSNYCLCLLADCIQVQRGPCQSLKIVEMEHKGLGLITLKDIPANSFIAEYAGEILTKTEVQKRHAENGEGMNYIVCLNEIAKDHQGESIQTFIDPKNRGNIGRYLNHSCDPNCTIYSVRTCNIIPKLGIFTNRAIASNTELTFSYGNYDDSTEDTKVRKRCYCKSTKCNFYLPNFSYEIN